jgi:dihydrofolate synthase/folylpolyglutamate synthase
MTYGEACLRLEALRPARVRLGLERIRALLERLGRPQLEFPGVLVVGTNGKGSTAAMLESILRAAGHRTGLYTSPHLVSVRERIQVGGRPLPRRLFTTVLELVLREARRLPRALGPVTYFEALTAAGFLAFAQERVELALVEVGLGGRFDATNAFDPLLTILTSVSLDHQEHLGTTVARIAAEKAGVLRGQPLLSGPLQAQARRVVRSRCREVGSRMLARGRASRLESDSVGRYSFAWGGGGRRLRLRLALAGRHQVDNAVMALSGARFLAGHGFASSWHQRRLGLRRVQWPGRLQTLAGRPPLLLDGAHNPAGMQTLVRHLRRFYRDRPIVAVFGVTRRRAAHGLLELLKPSLQAVVLTRVPGPRGLEPRELLAESSGLWAAIEPRPRSALLRACALAPKGGLVLVSGSLYLVGEALAARDGERRALLAA